MREWVEDGTPESQFSQAEKWRDEQKYMADLAQRVKERMSQAGVSIEGEGGDAMQNAVAPVALWTEVSADNAEAQAQRMESQGEAFKKVQTSVPKQGEEQHPPEDHFLESVGSSLGFADSDNDVAQEHNEKLRQEAVTAFQGYDNTSQNNVQSSAVFTAPPEAGKNPVVSSGPPPPQAGGVDTGGMSSGGSAETQSASAGGGVGGGSAGGSVGGGAGGSAGGHSPAPSSPAGTAPSSSAPAPQPWQQGTLEPPRGGPQGGMGGGLAAGAMPGGGSAGGGAAGGGKAGGAGGGTGAGGRGGSAGGAGGSGSGGSGGGRGALGPGGSAGSGSAQPGAQGGASSSSANGGRGGAGGAGMGGGGRGAGSQGEEDEEHYSPEFLKGDYGFFDEDVPRVAPPVFGEDR